MIKILKLIKYKIKNKKNYFHKPLKDLNYIGI